VAQCRCLGRDKASVFGAWHSVGVWSVTKRLFWGVAQCWCLGRDKASVFGAWHSVGVWGVTKRLFWGRGTVLVFGA